jgi:organic radical activating enzyme
MYPLNDEPGSRMVFPGLTLVITGGEPLLQENLTNFLYRQALIFENVQIESNGILDTRVPTAVTLVCSPKCAEKDGVATAYLKPSTTILRRANYLKFVISSDLSSPYSEIPSWALEWKDGLAGRDVYVSPMNVYNKLPEKAKVLREARRAADGLAPTLEERSTEDEVVSFWEKGLFNLEQNQKNHEYAARYCLEHGLRFNMQTHLFASLA